MEKKRPRLLVVTEDPDSFTPPIKEGELYVRTGLPSEIFSCRVERRRSPVPGPPLLGAYEILAGFTMEEEACEYIWWLESEE